MCDYQCIVRVWMSSFEWVNYEDLSGNIFNCSPGEVYFLQCQSTVESFKCLKCLSDFVLHFTVNSRVILVT
jgi:transcription initiation factor IIE alpha subunit